MSAITNSSPTQSVNSLLKPLGLTLSNKQQMIDKIKLIAPLAIIATCGATLVSAQQYSFSDDVSNSRSYQHCLRSVCEQLSMSLYYPCVEACSLRLCGRTSCRD